MQNELQPEPTESEADAQAARLVTERLNEITKQAKCAKSRFETVHVIATTCLMLGVILLYSLRWQDNPLIESLAVSFAVATWILWPFKFVL